MNKTNKKIINLFEVFAGIGSQRTALKEMGLEVTHLGSIEWFVDAIVMYQLFHDEHPPQIDVDPKKAIKFLNSHSFSNNSKSLCGAKFWNKTNSVKYYPYLKKYLSDGNWTNIKTFQTLPENIDIFTYSFPCQDLSSQGKCKGLGAGTRSGLLFEVGRILQNNVSRLPKMLVLENVSNLNNPKFTKEFDKWKALLNDLGYFNSVKILNALDFGSPQNRKRLFMVSQLHGKSFTWDTNQPQHNHVLQDVMIDDQMFMTKWNKYQRTPFTKSKSGIVKSDLIGYSTFASSKGIYHIEGKGPTLTATGANSRIKVFFPKHNAIRYMNAKECMRYMGFCNIDKILSFNLLSERRIIFLAGNSIPIPLLMGVFKSVVNALTQHNTNVMV